MTEPEARRVFANLMQKARKGHLSEHERLKLSIARQKLRRAKRPAMNAETPKGIRIATIRTQSKRAAIQTAKKYFPGEKIVKVVRKNIDTFLVTLIPEDLKNPIELGYRSKKTGRGRHLSIGVSRSQANPPSLQRIGRAVEVRYHRTIGRSPGYYKHEIRSRSAGVYTIPPGWVYVGSKSILITEKLPRVR